MVKIKSSQQIGIDNFHPKKNPYTKSFKVFFIICAAVIGMIITLKYNQTVQDTDIGKLYRQIEFIHPHYNDTMTILKNELPCIKKEFKFQITQHEDYWIFQNYIRAEHGAIRCFESITYTTHGDFIFLRHIIPLVERWKAPVSFVLEAEGSDYNLTVESIFYLRNCVPSSVLVRQFATFHLYFNYKHVPQGIDEHPELSEIAYKCPKHPPYQNKTPGDTYYRKQNLTYQINLARNLAIKAALTYFIFPCDDELYPSLNLVPQFLDMIARNISLIKDNQNVFFLPVFEVDADQKVPNNKNELKMLYHQKKADFFHIKICRACHMPPDAFRWINNMTIDDGKMEIYVEAKRQARYYHWEPFFISTQDVPMIFDEKLDWDGKFDKMTMEYILCLLDYNFMGLSNAFLVHAPGFKKYHETTITQRRSIDTLGIVKNFSLPDITKIFGRRKGCKMF